MENQVHAITIYHFLFNTHTCTHWQEHLDKQNAVEVTTILVFVWMYFYAELESSLVEARCVHLCVRMYALACLGCFFWLFFPHIYVCVFVCAPCAFRVTFSIWLCKLFSWLFIFARAVSKLLWAFQYSLSKRSVYRAVWHRLGYAAAGTSRLVRGASRNASMRVHVLCLCLYHVCACVYVCAHVRVCAFACVLCVFACVCSVMTLILTPSFPIELSRNAGM